MMTRFITLTSAICLIFCLATEVRAQVVQLPSIRTFSYSGSVLVPDGGSTYLGGVSRSGMNSRRRGLSRSFGQSIGSSGAVASVTIIDLQAMDREILGSDPKDFVRSKPSLNPAHSLTTSQDGKAATAVSGVNGDGVNGDGVNGDGVNGSGGNGEGRNEEGKSLVRFARRQFRLGNQSSSVHAYAMAISVLDGKLRQLAMEEFRRLYGPVADQTIAQL